MIAPFTAEIERLIKELLPRAEAAQFRLEEEIAQLRRLRVGVGYGYAAGGSAGALADLDIIELRVETVQQRPHALPQVKLPYF